jgi:hypothetical protein
VEELLRTRLSTQFVNASITCGAGARDWDYICQARYEPTPLAVRQGVGTLEQRIGLQLIPPYDGAPNFSIAVLPSDGQIPSMEELATQAQHQVRSPGKPRSGS